MMLSLRFLEKIILIVAKFAKKIAKNKPKMANSAEH